MKRKEFLKKAGAFIVGGVVASKLALPKKAKGAATQSCDGPFGSDGAYFYDSTKCTYGDSCEGECVDVCPVQGFQIVTTAQGNQIACFTPQIDECINCGKCVEVCPAEAIVDAE